MKYVHAKRSDLKEIQKLLFFSGLPSSDVGSHVQKFVIAKAGKLIAGVIGMEVYGKDCLFRSLAVRRSFQGKGIARELFCRIVADAQKRGIVKAYVLTMTIEKLCQKWGFIKIPKVRVPRTITASKEFQGLCPKTAVLMCKNIAQDVQYYPKGSLLLEPDVKGAKMWGVALKKTMLTYFEMKPCCRFKMHSHKSEQITMVFQGELFFDTGKGIYGVKEGEVIAIPSMVPHAVFTRSTFVKAADAWSPVMGKYKK